ncbi:MAG: agmatine/peptidylarginine deiminase [Bernardetiaceae bacterium]
MSLTKDFRFPAEWELHRATWLSYPYLEDSFPGRLEKVWPVFAQFVAVLSEGEAVCINVPDAEQARKARAEFRIAGADLSKITFFAHPTDDVWCRDHGGIFLKNNTGDQIILDWAFTAWGGKYAHAQDAQIAQKMALARGLPTLSPGIVMEGGAIENNGAGTLLTTEGCLLHPNRNPELSKDQIESYLKTYFNAQQVLWLGEGIVGDDTDGHIDDLTRFVAVDTVLTVLETDPQDINYDPLQENFNRLKSFKLPDGRPLNIHTLPMPDPVCDSEGNRLPASYANFYIANHAVIVPTFACPQDAEALAIIGRHFRHRRVVGLDSRDIVAGFGSFHCLSQQEPL